jgi:ATP-dependent Clp protease protease subunit
MTIRQQLSVKQYEEAVNFAGRRHPFNYSIIPDGSGSSVTATIIDAKKKRGQIVMYGAIGMDWFGDGITAKSFEKELKALGAVDELEIRINSEGGSVHDARAIYNLLNVHKARKEVHIDSLAASAASFVAMAGDSITIAESGFFMIHNARMFAGGTAEDFDAAANFLRTVNRTIADTYVARTGVSAEKIKKWMDAETWFTGQEALDAGFATAIVENKQGGEAKAKTVSPLFNYAHVPAAIRANRAKALALMGR